MSAEEGEKCHCGLLVQGDLTGMLMDCILKPGLTVSGWLEQFNLGHFSCDRIRNTERWMERDKKRSPTRDGITGKLQLNNTHCADGVLGYLSHTEKTLTCTVLAALLQRLTVSPVQQMLLFLLTLTKILVVSLKAPHALTHLNCCGKRYYPKMWSDCETIKDKFLFGSENETISGWQPCKNQCTGP